MKWEKKWRKCSQEKLSTNSGEKAPVAKKWRKYTWIKGRKYFEIKNMYYLYSYKKRMRGSYCSYAAKLRIYPSFQMLHTDFIPNVASGSPLCLSHSLSLLCVFALRLLLASCHHDASHALVDDSLSCLLVLTMVGSMLSVKKNEVLHKR